MRFERSAMKARTRLWIVAVGILVAAAAGYAGSVETFDAPGWSRILAFAAIGMLMPVVYLLQPEATDRRGRWLYLWVPALLARAVLLPTAPSDDINRYLWEGKLVAGGMSPYIAPAEDEIWIGERDAYWEAMNHRDKPTAYPPLVLWLFGTVGSIAYHPMGLKIAFVLADLLCLGLILSLLRGRGLSAAQAQFYSLNPLVLIAYAGEAHFDAWMVAGLVGGLWLVERGRRGLGVAAVATAAALKWVALPLLPFVLFARGRSSGRPWRDRGIVGGVVAGAVILGLPLLAFGDGNPGGSLSGLLEFGTTRSFNGPVHALLSMGLGLSREMATGLLAVAFLGVGLWRWRVRGQVALDSQFRWILGALVILSPTVHFWYLAWLIPLVALRPSLPWLVLSVSAGIYFRVWSNAVDGDWGLEVWEMLVFWVPFGVAVLYEVWSTRGAILRTRRDSGVGLRVGVVIPTLNAENDLPRALKSVSAQTAAPAAVVIADGGSRDRTLEIASGARVAIPSMCLIESEPGRGQQILAGIGATGDVDWVLVLHADGQLRPDAIDLLRRAVGSHPQVIGGAFGQRFPGGRPVLVWIEAMNDFRALFNRTAFGDQVQFFRRDVCLDRGIVPPQPLMEDVESSWRLRETGEFLFLGQPCPVSDAKWNRCDWSTRVAQVARLVARYRWTRLRGRDAAAALSRKLYREYYR